MLYILFCHSFSSILEHVKIFITVLGCYGSAFVRRNEVLGPGYDGLCPCRCMGHLG